MLNRFYVNPILPAQDGDRARRFYRDVLGLDLLTGPTDDPMVFGAAEGSSVGVVIVRDHDLRPLTDRNDVDPGCRLLVERYVQGRVRAKVPQR